MSDTSADDVPGGESDRPTPRRILVAEDEHLVAINLVDNLENLGHEVVGPAANGAQAVEMAKQLSPDLVLLDIKMPEMDGLEAAKKIFGQMQIPVVIISAYSDPEFIDAGADLGVFGYLLKPATKDELRVTIAVAWSRWLEHKRLRNEVQTLKADLENRKIIEKAKGVLMKQLKLDEDEAMKRLHKYARDSRRKLVDAAKAILETQDLLGS